MMNTKGISWYSRVSGGVVKVSCKPTSLQPGTTVINQQMHNLCIYTIILHYNIKDSYMFRPLLGSSSGSTYN
jgi:hypothetical protein